MKNYQTILYCIGLITYFTYPFKHYCVLHYSYMCEFSSIYESYEHTVTQDLYENGHKKKKHTKTVCLYAKYPMG